MLPTSSRSRPADSGCDSAFAGRIGMSWVDTAVAALFPPDARSRCGAQVAFSHTLPSKARFVTWWKVRACAPAPRVRRRHFSVFLGFEGLMFVLITMWASSYLYCHLGSWLKGRRHKPSVPVLYSPLGFGQGLPSVHGLSSVDLCFSSHLCLPPVQACPCPCISGLDKSTLRADCCDCGTCLP